jgi:subtilase family serine protease
MQPTSARMHPTDLANSAPTSVSLSNGKLSCQKPSAQYYCYLPAQIRNAYAIQPLLDRGANGAGQTIAIIDAFQDPTIGSDLARFDSVSGMLAPPRFRVLAPYGLTPFDPTDSDQVGWSGEIALDVEWAHAIAPAANIDLYLAASDNDPDILNVEQYVIAHREADVISMSYTEAEQCMDPGVQSEEHAAFQAAAEAGITLLAGSGDWGAGQYSCDGSTFIKAVGLPASDPLVTGIGGTTLHADLKTGAYENELVWDEGTANGAGGGGFSTLYRRPAYQAGINAPGFMRGVPDVTYNASAYWGVYVAWGSSGQAGSPDWSFYGTSCGGPQWAGIVAIGDQLAGRDLGDINPTLYRQDETRVFHDITVGDNSFDQITGYPATRGWDAASGLGSPIAASLVPRLISSWVPEAQSSMPASAAPTPPTAAAPNATPGGSGVRALTRASG